MKASGLWLNESGADFLPGPGIIGCAPLTHYTVNYQIWGEGPPLILVPGLAGGIGLLGPLVKSLAQHYRVIAYHTRGEDNCFSLRQPFHLPDLANDLKEFIDLLCLENPAIFGISFGGIIALEYASRFPYRLQNLILQGVGARFEGGLVQRVARAVLNRFPLPSDNPFINQFFNILFGCAQKKDILFHFVTQQCWKTDQSVMAHRLRLVEEFNMTGRLERIQVPTLVLAGDKDVMVSGKSLQTLVGGIEKARLRPLPGAGHLACVTQPLQITQEIHQFFRENLDTLIPVE